MRSRLLITNCGGLLRVTPDACLDGRLALMRFVALDAIGVTMVLLRLVAIDAVARWLRLGMSSMTSEAIRVMGVRPCRYRLTFLLVAGGAVNSRNFE